MKDCKHYDSELDCCKLFSDWSQPMPTLFHCYEKLCNKYEPIKECENNGN